MSELGDIEQPFRTLQAISDLRAIVQAAGGATLTRLASGVDIERSSTLLRALIFQDGCRFSSPDTLKLHQKLVLAAALPNDDFDGFQIATAILIADRLQRGLGPDDLYWHWDAFQQHYALSPPHIRSSILHGFRRLHVEGLVVLADPPAGDALLTETRAEVETILENERGARATAILEAVGDDPVAPGFWSLHCAPELGPARSPSATLVRGIRHVFESHLEWSPTGAQRLRAISDVRLIPLIPH